MYGAWLGWFPSDAQFDRLKVYELEEYDAVVRQKMEAG